MAYLLVHLLLLVNTWWLIALCVTVGYGCGKFNGTRTVMLFIAAGIASVTFLLYSRQDMFSPMFGGGYFAVPGRYYGRLAGIEMIAAVVFGFWIQRREHR